MAKYIKQTINENGTVDTFTKGTAVGNIPNFDVSISSPPVSYHKPTTMRMRFFQFGRMRSLNLTGRQARTLYDVLSKHFSNINE